MSPNPVKLAKAPLKKALKDAGADRVSDTAADQFAYLTGKWVEKVAKKAVENARHAKRKTVKVGDVRLAAKEPIGVE